MPTQVFTEQLDLTEAILDNDARVLKDVVLIRAGKSDNGRYYPAEVLAQAVSVFEGTKAYADHPTMRQRQTGEARGIRDITGWYANVRYDKSVGRLLADRYFARTQAGSDVYALAQDIVTNVAPTSLAGLSINAVGKASQIEIDGEETLSVDEITAANSVDDVSAPAAGGMYLAAGKEYDDLTAALLAAIDFQEWQEAQPDYVARLKKEWGTVRQTDALKQARAEADQQVKAARAEAGQLTEALTNAQATETKLQADIASLQESLDLARRETAIERALRAVNLPAVWEKSLRVQLAATKADDWDTIIAEEIRKAGTGPKRPKVTGAGKRAVKPLQMTSQPSTGPIDMNAVKSPEHLQQIIDKQTGATT